MNITLTLLFASPSPAMNRRTGTVYSRCLCGLDCRASSASPFPTASATGCLNRPTLRSCIYTVAPKVRSLVRGDSLVFFGLSTRPKLELLPPNHPISSSKPRSRTPSVTLLEGAARHHEVFAIPTLQKRKARQAPIPPLGTTPYPAGANVD